MEKEVIAALEKQATHELYAAQSYLAMAYWSEVRQYSGFAKFFHLQVAEEREHAEKIFKFLADRDVVPTVGPLESPRNTFAGLLEVARSAYDLERKNTAGIHAAYETALRAKDYPAQVMLHWFISEQVEEEAWSDKLVVKVQEATCAGALSSLDRHIIKELRGREEESD
jgi:ferritin